MAANRTANVVWQGDLKSGGGTIESATSGVLGGLGVSWATRSEEPNGQTSPEELIAAAWASCFSMALSGGLARGETPPERLEVSATVTLVPGEGITKGALKVRGTVPGLDAEGFKSAAEGAKQNCPVSKALTGIPEITLDAELA
jgi:lipoyl-dependent peroxiredoxin